MLMFFVIICLLLFIILKLNSAKIKGFFGEARVNAKVRFLGSDYFSIHDIMLKNSKGFTSQIDHLVLSEYGIFVIETKNYKGWIFGNEKSENWTQVLYDEKYQFRNPVRQNWSHVYTLKEVLADFPNVRYFPIVVFVGNATLKSIESTVPVIYKKYLNRTIRKLSTEKCITAEQVEQIKEQIGSFAVTEKDDRREHIKNIRQYVYERETKIGNLICPKCNGKLKLKEGKNGKFYGCSNYPRCNFTMSY